MKTKLKTTAILLAFLFLFMPLSFDVNAESEQKPTVILGGDAFGIKMFCDGVLVIKTQDVYNSDGRTNPADDAGLSADDIIITANGKYLTSCEELKKIVENSQGDKITLKYLRDEEYRTTSIIPKKDNENKYRLGIWIKDSTAGIGTVTFYCNNINGFCALGHGICDSDTGILMPISSGEAEKANITSVTKSSNGKVGTLNGYFTNDFIGTALQNDKSGIYGKTENKTKGKEIEIANNSDVKTGKAYIYTTIEGNKPKKYEIEIIKLKKSADVDLVFQITDEEILNKTGGIVQGMSGSPIVQNGKLVAAVTHVVVENVSCGYGRFADTMYDNLENVCE